MRSNHVVHDEIPHEIKNKFINSSGIFFLRFFFVYKERCVQKVRIGKQKKNIIHI